VFKFRNSLKIKPSVFLAAEDGLRIGAVQVRVRWLVVFV